MTSKIFSGIFSTAVLVLLISVALIFGILYNHSEKTAEGQLDSELSLAAAGVEEGGMGYLDRLPEEDIRVTLIDREGKVLFDNMEDDLSSLENHKDREEIREAEETGYGRSARFSKTMTERMIYAAKKISEGRVLRVSMTTKSALSIFLGVLQPVAIILIFLIILSFVLASRLSRSIVKPLNELDLDHPLENEKYEELDPLLGRLNVQQNELKERETSLKEKQDELDTILSNMSEGMLFLNDQSGILSLNQAARRILEIDGNLTRGENLLNVTRDLDLISLVDKALKGKNAEDILSLHGASYHVSCAPIFRPSEGGEEETGSPAGAAVIFFDVTDSVMAEEMRKEFTANVSHELKTPLHSISGFSELMKNGLVAEADVKKFAGRIYDEAQRMIQLIEDIISLSHLDEGAEDVTVESLDLYDLAASSVKNLKAASDDKDITVRLEGYPVRLRGKKALLKTMISNLIDNAIKYTPKGGKVLVSVGLDEMNAVFTVKDNGIGISKADQKRIFERFYQADKSHSREIGGTGLGLSIVKHAVLIHKGKIRVVSTPGEGSEFIVNLPVASAID